MHPGGTENSAKCDSSRRSAGDRLRRPYCAPRMRKAGNLYEVTLGGSPGNGDSVNTSTTQNQTKRGSRPPFPRP